MNQSRKKDEKSFKFKISEHGDKIVMTAKHEGQFIEDHISLHFSENKEFIVIDSMSAYDIVHWQTAKFFREHHRIPYEFDRKTLKHEMKDTFIRVTANKTGREDGNKCMSGYSRSYYQILCDKVLGPPDPYMSEIPCRYREYEFSEDDGFFRLREMKNGDKEHEENICPTDDKCSIDEIEKVDDEKIQRMPQEPSQKEADVERQKAEGAKNMSQEKNDSSDDEEKAEKDDEEKEEKDYAAKQVKGDEEPVEDICATGEQSSNEVIIKVTITDKRPGDNNDSVVKEFNLKEKHVRMEKIQEEKLKNGAKRKHGNKSCVTGEASSNEEIEKVADENCQQMLQERIIEVTNNEESKEEEKEEIEGVGHHEREEGTNSDSDGSFVKLLDEEHEEQTDEEVGTLEKTEAEEREEGTNSDSDGSFVKLLPEEREEKVSDSDDSWEKHLEVESWEESHTASSEEWEVVDEEKRN